MDKTFEFKFFDGQVFRGPGRDATDALNRLGLGAYNPVAYDVEEIPAGQAKLEFRAKALKEAAKQVREVLASLDISSKNCECCNRALYHNWGEWQAHVQLTALADKLDRYVKSNICTGED